MYRRFGLVALARKGRSDSGSRRTLSPQMQALVEEKAEPPPSYAVVYDIVRWLPADLVMLAHKGTKAYEDTFEIIYRREAERPNAIWQADHTLLDILLVRGDDTKAREGSTTASKTPQSSTISQFSTLAKPWLTIIIKVW